MPTIADIMTTDVQVIEPEETLQRAAQIMQDLNIGALPVCTGRRLLGMVTDRDITVRGVANGLVPAQACVSDVMTADAEFCSAEQDTREVMRQMGEMQLRRMPVVNADRELVGIVSLGDLALRQEGHIDRTVREISEPGSPHPASA
jgi:CBS-domain-containing membrane protein